MAERLEMGSLPVELLVADIRESNPTRVSGTAIFMHKDPTGTPPALLHNIKHNRVLHERIDFLSIATVDIPRVRSKDRVRVVKLADDMYRIVASYGFTESPDVPAVSKDCSKHDLTFEMMKTTFFLSRETLVSRSDGVMARWRQQLFSRMSRNALQATAYFGIPPNRVVEFGIQVQL